MFFVTGYLDGALGLSYDKLVSVVRIVGCVAGERFRISFHASLFVATCVSGRYLKFVIVPVEYFSQFCAGKKQIGLCVFPICRQVIAP